MRSTFDRTDLWLITDDVPQLFLPSTVPSPKPRAHRAAVTDMWNHYTTVGKRLMEVSADRPVPAESGARVGSQSR
jgi:hypothetical protein